MRSLLVAIALSLIAAAAYAQPVSIGGGIYGGATWTCSPSGCVIAGSLLNTGVTAAPTALTTALVVIAGNIDAGAHSYQVTFVTAGGETSAGATSNSVTNDVTHAQNTLTSVPLGNQFVTQRKIYRNTVAAPTVYKLQQTIANNTATSGVQDNTADSGLGAVIPTANTAIDNRLTLTNAGVLTNSGGVRISYGSSTDGSVSTLQTGAGNGETINTANVGLARYIAVAARTGVILQSGTYDGQIVTVINEDTTAGNSITFAVVATSHVANGVTTVINGLQGRRFVWSASAATPAWYELK